MRICRGFTRKRSRPVSGSTSRHPISMSLYIEDAAELSGARFRAFDSRSGEGQTYLGLTPRGVPNGAYDEEPVDWRATNKIVVCIKKLETRRTSALVRRARILAAVYSGSALPFADVLSMLGERLEVLHVL